MYNLNIWSGFNIVISNDISSSHYFINLDVVTYMEFSWHSNNHRCKKDLRYEIIRK